MRRTASQISICYGPKVSHKMKLQIIFLTIVNGFTSNCTTFDPRIKNKQILESLALNCSQIIKNQESTGIHSDLNIFANTLTSFSSGQFGSDELYKRSNKSKIPAEFVRDSKGIAIVTKLVGLGVKQIFGIGGTGLVLKNHGNGNWYGPSAFRMVTFDWFLGIGVDTSTYIFILNTDEAVDMFQKVGKFHHGAGVLDNIGGKLPIDVWAFHNSIYHVRKHRK